MSMESAHFFLSVAGTGGARTADQVLLSPAAEGDGKDQVPDPSMAILPAGIGNNKQVEPCSGKKKQAGRWRVRQSTE